MDRSRALTCRRLGIRQSILHKKRVPRQAGGVIERIDVELVLALDRDKGPGFDGVKVEMARAEAETVAARDRRQVSQHAILECECLDRAGILRLVRCGV